jgi:hypothetical protein
MRKTKSVNPLDMGKALVSECLNRLLLLEGDKDIFLHTQAFVNMSVPLTGRIAE